MDITDTAFKKAIEDVDYELAGYIKAKLIRFSGKIPSAPIYVMTIEFLELHNIMSALETMLFKKGFEDGAKVNKF